MLRSNAASRTNPDPYGNMQGSMVPGGLIPRKNLMKKKQISDLNNLTNSTNVTSPYNSNDPNAIAKQARDSVSHLKELKKPEDQTYSVDPNAVSSSITNNVDSYKSNVKAGMSKKAAGATAIADVGLAVADVGGSALVSNKKEVSGYGLKGLATGAKLGMSIGSLAGPIGTLIGGGAGAVIGGVSGLLYGKHKKKKREKLETKEETARNEYNAKIKKVKRQTIGQGEDLAQYNKVLQDSQKYDSRGNLKYRKGGILKYDTLNVKEGKEYLARLEKERAVEKHKKGGSLKDKPIVMVIASVKEEPKPKAKGKSKKEEDHSCGCGMKDCQGCDKKAMVVKKSSCGCDSKEKDCGCGSKKTARTFKKGGKSVSSCGKGCSCIKCSGKAPRMFRRGGPMDLAKQNVIIDGPSHDQANNTGAKGDKGLPVIKNGEKVAEIESEELVINAASSKKIEALRSRAISGDNTARKELADLLETELKENTYDYSNVTD